MKLNSTNENEPHKMDLKEADLEWKEFFGSSVSLVPSLVSMYDKKIKEDVDSRISSRQDPKKRPLSLRSDGSILSVSVRKKGSAESNNVTSNRLECITKGHTYSTLDRGLKLKEQRLRSKRSKSAENGRREIELNSNLVCREIVETEKSYLRDLQEMINGYMLEMESKPDIFSIEKIKILFGNIKEIFQFHSKLSKELIRHIDSAEALSDCFISNVSNFEIYSTYCTNFSRSQEVLTSLTKQGNEIGTWLIERQIVLEHKLPLSSYLLKPVQRILKYHLLFQNLLKSLEQHGEVGSIEFEKVSLALSCMSSVARYINEAKRIHDKNVKMQKALDILTSCNPQLESCSIGNLLLEDKFQFSSKSLQHVMLFEKQILICKWKDSCTLLVKVQIPCSNLMLVETVSKSPLSFSIHPFTNPSLLFTILAKNQEQKTVWCREIRKTILCNFEAHVPEKAKSIVMNVTPELSSVTDVIDDGGFGQIEWSKGRRRSSLAFIPDISFKQTKKNNDKYRSQDDYSTTIEEINHTQCLPASHSLFSINSETLHRPLSFSSSHITSSPQIHLTETCRNCTSVCRLLSNKSDSSSKSFDDNESNVDIKSLQSFKSHRRCFGVGDDKPIRNECRNSLNLEKSSSTEDCLSSRQKVKENHDVKFVEISRRSNSVQESCSKKLSFVKRTESFLDSSVLSTSSKSSLKNTLMNLRDKLKKRSHSTDAHCHRSAAKLHSFDHVDNETEKTRKGPSHRMVARFAGRKSKLDQGNFSSKNIGEQLQRKSQESNLSESCPENASTIDVINWFSPPVESKILFIDDSDDDDDNVDSDDDVE